MDALTSDNTSVTLRAERLADTIASLEATVQRLEAELAASTASNTSLSQQHQQTSLALQESLKELAAVQVSVWPTSLWRDADRSARR